MRAGAKIESRSIAKLRAGAKLGAGAKIESRSIAKNQVKEREISRYRQGLLFFLQIAVKAKYFGKDVRTFCIEGLM